MEVIPSENHISHRDLIDSSKDSQFWAKIHEFDPELCALVDLYKNDAKENRQRMLTDINSRFEWKNFLNKQKSNFSIGKLEYLLKKNIGKKFEIIIGGDYDGASKHKTTDQSFKTIWKAYQQAIGYPLDLPHELMQDIVTIQCTGTIMKPNYIEFDFSLRTSIRSVTYYFPEYLNLEELFGFIKKSANHADFDIRSIIRFDDYE